MIRVRATQSEQIEAGEGERLLSDDQGQGLSLPSPILRGV